MDDDMEFLMRLREKLDNGGEPTAEEQERFQQIVNEVILPFLEVLKPIVEDMIKTVTEAMAPIVQAFRELAPVEEPQHVEVNTSISPRIGEMHFSPRMTDHIRYLP